MRQIITNITVITPKGTLPSAWIAFEAGKIYDFGQGYVPVGRVIDGKGLTVTAGFIDVHVHGSMGADVMDGSPQAIHTMSTFFAQQGVTGFAPTTLTSTHPQIMASLQAVRDAMANPVQGARIYGVHLEGPYLNKEKCGAQNPDYVRLVNQQEATDILDTGIIKILSVAPEFAENEWLIQECVRRGVTVSVAHTNATYAQAKRGIELGITHATHTYNAMTALHHREPGTLGAVLESDAVHCELICDHVHVHPGALAVAWRAKGIDRIMLITDAMRATGLGEGEYTLGELAVIVQGGKASLKDGTLAGSVLTYAEGVRRFMQATHTTLDQIWQTTSLNSARALGVDHHTGSIEIGKDADLVLLNPQDCTVMMTVVQGQIVYQR